MRGLELYNPFIVVFIPRSLSGVLPDAWNLSICISYFDCMFSYYQIYQMKIDVMRSMGAGQDAAFPVRD